MTALAPTLVARKGYVWVKCKGCRVDFEARIADRNRGWAKSCSKSCAASVSNAKTGKYARHIAGTVIGARDDAMSDSERMHMDAMDGCEAGWDGHKDTF